MPAIDRRTIHRPAPDEYAAYYATYVDKVPTGVPILELLETQLQEAQALLAGIDDERAAFRYAKDKWSVKEVIGHLVDTERIFACRALCFARGETRPLPGMDQDSYVARGGFDDRRLRDLAAEYRAVRGATLAQFVGFSDPQLSRRGVASECEFTTRAILYIIAGHERHHLDVLYRRYDL